MFNNWNLDSSIRNNDMNDIEQAKLNIEEMNALSSFGLIYVEMMEKHHPNGIKCSNKGNKLRDEDYSKLDQLEVLFKAEGLESFDNIKEFLEYVFKSKYEDSYFFDRLYQPRMFFKDFKKLIETYTLNELKENFDINDIKENIKKVKVEDYDENTFFNLYMTLCNKNNYPVNINYAIKDKQAINDCLKQLDKKGLTLEQKIEFFNYRFKNASEENYMKSDWLIHSDFDNRNYLDEFEIDVLEKIKRSRKYILDNVDEYASIYNFNVVSNIELLTRIGPSIYITALNQLALNDNIVAQGYPQFKNLDYCIYSVFNLIKTYWDNQQEHLRLEQKRYNNNKREASINEIFYNWICQKMILAEHKNDINIEVTSGNEIYNIDWGYELLKFCKQLANGKGEENKYIKNNATNVSLVGAK